MLVSRGDAAPDDLGTLLERGRRVPAASMAAVRRIASIETIADRLVAAATDRAREVEHSLRTRAQAELTALVAHDRLMAGRRLADLAEPLATELVEIVSALIGAQDATLLHERVVRQIAQSADRLATLRLVVAPDALEATRRRLGDGAALQALTLVIEADPSLGRADCRVHCGDRCHELVLDDWLGELSRTLRDALAESLAPMPEEDPS